MVVITIGHDYYHWSNIVFKNIPNRVEARFDAACVSDFAPIFQQNSHLTKISKLSPAMQYCKSSAGSLPTFCNLKQLTTMVGNTFDYELAPKNQLLKASPKLRELKVEFCNWDNGLLEAAYQLKELDSSSDDVETNMIQDWEYFESMCGMELERTSHPNLKEFQVAGFCGWNLDVKLILFGMLISCNLETIILDVIVVVPEVSEVFKVGRLNR